LTLNAKEFILNIREISSHLEFRRSLMITFLLLQAIFVDWNHRNMSSFEEHFNNLFVEGLFVDFILKIWKMMLIINFFFVWFSGFHQEFEGLFFFCTAVCRLSRFFIIGRNHKQSFPIQSILLWGHENFYSKKWLCIAKKWG
jgi:hypothetical protein